MTHLFSRLPRDIPGADISIIGPRSAGKTTFMASLARWSNASSETPILSVHPFDENAGRLIAIANDILENGLSIAPTRTDEDANNLSRYTLLIELKPPLFQKRNIRLQVSFREYAGEILRDLCGGSSGMNLRSYLDDCATSSGLLLLIDGTSREDSLYAQAFARLQSELNERLVSRNRSLKRYRIATVFSKAEQAQVWIHRHDIKKFVNLRFPQTKNTLKTWSKTWGCSVNYFMCSAFGIKGSPPTPNVKIQARDHSGTYGIIANPSVWRPFGLFAPILWLHTGKDDDNYEK